MKWYSEEVARNLLWMKPGVEFWYRQSAVGPVSKGVIINVITKYEFVICKHIDIPRGRFKLDLTQPQHMSTYPGDDNDQ